MVVVPLSKPAKNPDADADSKWPNSVSWLALTAAGTLAAGGILFLSGKPRAGLVAAASGTTLAMLDQQETVKAWWNALPNYLAEAQGLLGRVQTALEDVSIQRERLRQVLGK